MYSCTISTASKPPMTFDLDAALNTVSALDMFLIFLTRPSNVLAVDTDESPPLGDMFKLKSLSSISPLIWSTIGVHISNVPRYLPSSFSQAYGSHCPSRLLRNNLASRTA